MEDNKNRSYKILVYGIDKKGLNLPENEIKTRNYTLFFEAFTTTKKFSDYDGVILFKGIFEKFEYEYDVLDGRYLTHEYKRNELDKRKKEADLLLKEKGGFLCFLLDDSFIDEKYQRTDLAKQFLNYPQLKRKNTERITELNILSDEFREFLKRYGAASSYFVNENNSIDFRKLVMLSGYSVGMIINKNSYFLPTLIPNNTPEIILEYFKHLSNGLVSSYNKLQESIPQWTKEFSFVEEKEIIKQKEKAKLQLEKLNKKQTELDKFKSILVLSGDTLVENVALTFKDGFGISVDCTDEFREDLKLLDEKSKPFSLCEVKGTNKGVKREHINQADSHRERSGYDEKFPSLLVMNTHIKNARSIEEKYQEIAIEQIRHAAKMNVLVLRTIDLLGILQLYLAGSIKKDDIKKLLTNNCGWLRVEEETYSIINGSE